MTDRKDLIEQLRFVCDPLMEEAADALEAEQCAAVKPLHEWPFYPIVMPVTKDGQGPANIGSDAHELTWEVWESESLQSHGSYKYLSEAINEALRLSGSDILSIRPATEVAAEAKAEAIEAAREAIKDAGIKQHLATDVCAFAAASSVVNSLHTPATRAALERMKGGE